MSSKRLMLYGIIICFALTLLVLLAWLATFKCTELIAYFSGRNVIEASALESRQVVEEEQRESIEARQTSNEEQRAHIEERQANVREDGHVQPDDEQRVRENDQEMEKNTYK